MSRINIVLHAEKPPMHPGEFSVYRAAIASRKWGHGPPQAPPSVSRKPRYPGLNRSEYPSCEPTQDGSKQVTPARRRPTHDPIPGVRAGVL